MDEFIQVIAFIVFGIVALLGRLLSRKEPSVVLEEEEVTLPPWGNLPMKEEAPAPQTVEPETMPIQPPALHPYSAHLVNKETPVKPELKPVPAPKSHTDSPPPKSPEIAGIPLSPQTFRQGIILAEILGRPKSLRRPRQ
jgi:hypothetical protein